MRHFKRTLLVALALVLCVGAVVSGTIAWFTDTVESKGNIIRTGTLNVELYKDGAPVTTDTTIFTMPALWEPGAVSYANLTVKNTGALALWYELNFLVDDYNTIAGTEDSLLDVLRIAMLPQAIDPDTTTREDILASVEHSPSYTLAAFNSADTLWAVDDQSTENDETSNTLSLVLYWPTTYGNDVDNRYNLQNGKTVSKGKNNQLYLDLSLMLTAIQAPYESDAFNNQYDADAKNDVFLPVATGSAMVNALAHGNNVTLTKDVTVDTKALADFNVGATLNGGTLDAQGKTIRLENADNKTHSIYMQTGGIIRNLGGIYDSNGNIPTYAIIIDSDGGDITIENSTIAAQYAIQYSFNTPVKDNLTVTNCDITGSVYHNGPAVFTDCTFSNAQGASFINIADTVYAKDATFISCDFTGLIILTALDDAGELTLIDCTYSGEPINQDYIASNPVFFKGNIIVK